MARQDNGPARGTRDLYPHEVAKREKVTAALAGAYASFGYRRIETPCIEDIDRLTWGEGGDNEKLIFKIIRRGLDPVVEGGTSLSDLVDLGLRYDLTVPLTRFYANNAGKLPSPFRAMQIGPVWRGERPAKGRYRQFTQCDIDIFGEATGIAEYELLEATLAALAAIGIEPVHARVNDRRLLAAIAHSSGVPTDRNGDFYITLDKLDKNGWDGVRTELGSRGFEPSVGDRCEWLLTLLQGAETPDELINRAADRLSDLDANVLEELRSTTNALAKLQDALGGPSKAGFAYSLDPTLVRGMGYYTGQIFELAHPESAGSIGGGGRYDGLVGRSLDREVPACGMSIGFDRVVDMARFERTDLGVAVLHGDQEPAVLLSTARALRRPDRPAALVVRRGQMKRQLDELKEAGYTSFVSFEGDVVSAERSLS